MEKHAALILPINIASRVDVGRLLREADALDNFLRQAAIREPGTPVKLPKTSRLMDEFIATNQLNVLHEQDRKRVHDFLQNVRSKAPVMHMSFSADPSPQFVQKLMTWLRKEIHPQVLLQVGLQPSIGAGCIIRTTNKHFDLSLRQHFKKKRELLVTKIHGEVQAAPVAATPEVLAPAAPQPAAPVPQTAQAQPQAPAPAPSAPVAAAQAPAATLETPEELAAVVNAAIAQIPHDQAPAPAQTLAPAPQPPKEAQT